MITPTKFLDLDNSIIKISSDIIDILITENSIKIYELYDRLKNKYKDVIDFYYILSLDFLFLLGKISYSEFNDKLELII